MLPAVFALELIMDSIRDRSDPREISEVLDIIHPMVDLGVVSTISRVKGR